MPIQQGSKFLMIDKKAAKFEYKSSHRPMGIFSITNVETGKRFIASSLNLPGSFNRHRFQLNTGVHSSKSLQKEWTEIGDKSFEFEILEEIQPREDQTYDYAADLEFLEDLWLDKYEPYGDKGYNEKKKTREERLRMIAQNRKL